jgi:hypothetical protein
MTNTSNDNCKEVPGFGKCSKDFTCPNHSQPNGNFHPNTQPENWNDRFDKNIGALYNSTGNALMNLKVKAFIEETLAARDREWVEKIQKANLTTHCKMHVPCESCSLLILDSILQSYQTNKE